MKRKNAVIIGGGLWGGLLAYALRKKRPHVDFILYEDKQSFGGNHTWSFHGSDIEAKAFDLLHPFIKKSWPEYEVVFPSYRRSLDISYHALSSELFHSVLENEIPRSHVVFGKKISISEAILEGEVVFDCRGLLSSGNCGYQKFLGLELKTASPHQLRNPILMDATVDQIDGYRFLYMLPFDEETLLIEDTRYSENSFIDHYRIKEQIKETVRSKGWEIKDILREESGALPIPFEYTRPETDPNVVDLKGMFHDTTGYSLPDAARVISRIVESTFTLPALQNCVAAYRQEFEKNRQFFCFLNRMMFHATTEEQRYKTLEFFYQGSKRSIQKFYSGQMGTWDKIRFYLGKPPVDISKAFKVIIKNRELQREKLS